GVRDEGERAPRGACPVQHGRMRREVSRRCRSSFRRKQREREGAGAPRGAGTPPVAPPPVVRDEASDAGERREDRAAIGEPTNGGTVPVIDRIENGREPGGGGGWPNPPEQHAGCCNERSVPGDGVRVHEPGPFREIGIIEAVRERGERPPER